MSATIASEKFAMEMPSVWWMDSDVVQPGVGRLSAPRENTLFTVRFMICLLTVRDTGANLRHALLA